MENKLDAEKIQEVDILSPAFHAKGNQGPLQTLKNLTDTEGGADF